jgi:branched-chain amino acid transport system permease protein
MIADLTNAVLQGVMVGGLYALAAAGLSLIFGVMRLVNIAHGDLIVLASYLAFAVVRATGLHPFLSLVLVIPAMAAIGYALQRLLLNRTLGQDILPPLLVTFGISVIIQNGLLQGFSADNRKLQAGPIETLAIDMPGGLSIGVLPLVMFSVAVAVIAGLQLLFYGTELGRAFRAISDDRETARLMGIDQARLFGFAMALALAVCGIAGVFLGTRGSFDPAIGSARLLFAFEAVIIGGLGSLWGTLAGGVILGVAQGIGAEIDPGWQVLAGHLVFLAVLVARPQGLFAKAVA